MKIILNLILTLSFSLSCFGFLFGQKPTFKMNLEEVIIQEKRKSKTFTIGCYKHFSLKIHQYSFSQLEEIAVFLKKDSLQYLIEEVYVDIYFDNKDSLPPITIKLQKLSSNNDPGEIIYQQEVETQKNLRKNTIVLNIEHQNIYLPKEGVFITLAVEGERNRNNIWLKMTTRHKESYTYTWRVGSERWTKTQPFHVKKTTKFSTHPWNGSVGLKLKKN